MLRLLALSFLAAVPASAQIRVAYELAPTAIRGNVVDISGLDPYADPDEQESASGSHRSVSATIPLRSLGEAAGVRVAYIWFTNEDSGTVTSAPGVYLNLSGATQGDGFGWAGAMDLGYDYYNREALGILGLLPTFALSVGPRLGLGPLAVEATVGTQMTSILQGIALTGRVGLVVGS